MTDPFKLTGSTCLSFSGGRTSAYMLWRVLQANTREDIARWLVVCFANTGKEEEATLRFVQACSSHWSISITWLEYTAGPTFKVVSFEHAARLGEPFEAVIAQRGGILPNRVSRFCSSELKTRTIHRYLRSLGWCDWDSLVGIRADEPRRVAKFRANPSPETKSEEVFLPLAVVGIGAKDVGAFWDSQPFDLELPNNGGKTMHGNCDLCYLKPANQVMSLIAERPARAIWWAKQETRAESTIPKRITEVPQFVEKLKAPAAYLAELDAWDGDELESPAPRPTELIPLLDAAGNQVVKRYEEVPTAARFRDDRPSYSQMQQFAADQRDMFDAEEEAIACFCGD